MKQKPKSLRKKIQNSYIFIILVMLIPAVYSLTISYIHSKQYDSIIRNVSRANQINLIVKDKVTIELWNIVSGNISFNQGNQYTLLGQIGSGIDELLENTSEGNKQKLEVAKRTLVTLHNNVSALGQQIARGESVKATELQLDEIRSIASLLSDILQEFIILEIESAYQTNITIQHASIIFTIVQVIIFTLVMFVAITQLISISNSIQKPIADMEHLSTQIAQGDLTARVTPPAVVELKHLAENMNTMTSRIDLLIKQNIQEQQNLQKAELKALQAQITPHFLYNTFDTIIWLAEEERTSDVVNVTRAFSEFLRISLSRGHEWITVQQELDHVRNYLTIQKIRYSLILNYNIQAEESLNGFTMLKLILQPLVENAIYHGIKNKRGRGHIEVSAEYDNPEHTYMRFTIKDDGAGFTPDRLEEVRQEILTGTSDSETLNSVYGLYNVNKRLVLYYENRCDGLHIESESGKGTSVYFKVPCLNKQEDENV